MSDKAGPGYGVRVQGSSPLDTSWEVLDKNEHGLIVEGNAAGDAEVPMQEPDTVPQQTSEQARKEGEGGRGKEANNEPGKEKIKCEIGESVVHQKYGYGVVRWVGEVGGEKMTGIELVGTYIDHSPHPLILYTSLYRKTTELVVGMGVCQAQVSLCSLAVKVAESSAPPVSCRQTPELPTLHWRKRTQHLPADPASCLRRGRWWR